MQYQKKEKRKREKNEKKKENKAIWLLVCKYIYW